MIPTRTDDLRFASWLRDAVPTGFEVYRRIPHGDEGITRDTLLALVEQLRAVTPAYLQREVCLGLWEGHPGIFGGAAEVPGTGSPAGGRLGRAVAGAVHIGARISSSGDRRRAERAAWMDDLTHQRLELSGHRYLLFRGPLAPVIQWARDRGPVPFRHAPDLIWPDDHSWIVSAPPDLGFIVVAGTRELADALDADPRLSVM
ncbi:hypothetical protein [Acidipropionibacterium virtanenii]|uniref:Uncharacterized protein n=1 Tax=Acidipropionibacterium virtanenii TaxID=2057246 RepID=A0A344UY79_9ACTN|nr:hypothetical protein [Acidipropionibacterium virtanenii]AXE40227.1 hypothetical protein JS278_03093 [Acidipropionibacterium virtanenii]